MLGWMKQETDGDQEERALYQVEEVESKQLMLLCRSSLSPTITFKRRCLAACSST